MATLIQIRFRSPTDDETKIAKIGRDIEGDLELDRIEALALRYMEDADAAASRRQTASCSSHSSPRERKISPRSTGSSESDTDCEEGRPITWRSRLTPGQIERAASQRMDKGNTRRFPPRDFSARQ